MTASAQRAQQKIEERIAGIRWYHSIRLGNGVVTPGIFDHVPFLSKHPLPERMDGMRVLDVGTFDGFWAFEFEKRGAAEVVALDIGKRRDLDLQPRIRNGLTSEELQEEFGRGFLTGAIKSKSDLDQSDVRMQRFPRFAADNFDKNLRRIVEETFKALINDYFKDLA